MALFSPRALLAAEDVVRIQVDALLESEDKPYGICQCFCFASPSNRRVTGPIARFASMFDRPPYDVFLTSRKALVGSSHESGREARVVVTFVNDDELRVFQFELSRQQEEPYQDCWMTDRVFDVTSGLVSSSAAAPPPLP